MRPPIPPDQSQLEEQRDHGQNQQASSSQDQPVRNLQRAEPEQITHRRHPENDNLEHLRTQHGTDQDKVRTQRHRKGRTLLRPAVEAMRVFAPDEQPENRPLCRGRGHTQPSDRPIIIAESRQTDDRASQQQSLCHATIEYRSAVGTGSTLQDRRIAGLEGERHVLDAIGDQVQPKQLNRGQRWRQRKQRCEQHQQDFGASGR